MTLRPKTGSSPVRSWLSTKRLTVDEIAQIWGMLNGGAKVRDIARSMNCHPTTIHRLVKRFE